MNTATILALQTQVAEFRNLGLMDSPLFTPRLVEELLLALDQKSPPIQGERITEFKPGQWYVADLCDF